MHIRKVRALAIVATAAALVSGCTPGRDPVDRIDPDAARAQIERLLPPQVDNPHAWAADIFTAFESLGIAPTVENSCAVIAVTAQESTFQESPRVPGLSGIALKQMESKASDYGVPGFAVRVALEATSTNGETYRARLNRATTEKELSQIYDDFIGRVPLGGRLFANLNPVRTGGPMQVSIAYAEQHAASHRYPYPTQGRIRDEVFTRRGGMYFGIAHLLDYPASYDAMLYRFADFNAGHYASRNAAFQRAASIVSQTKLALDGDLMLHGDRAHEASKTELALRKAADRLKLSPEQIRSDLQQSDEHSFEDTRLYARTFELADKAGSGRPVARAVLPEIQLKSPKIQRKLTTGWFATRVQSRYEQCLTRGR
jgi:hypothetical protein